MSTSRDSSNELVQLRKMIRTRNGVIISILEAIVIGLIIAGPYYKSYLAKQLPNGTLDFTIYDFVQRVLIALFCAGLVPAVTMLLTRVLKDIESRQKHEEMLVSSWRELMRRIGLSDSTSDLISKAVAHKDTEEFSRLVNDMATEITDDDTILARILERYKSGRTKSTEFEQEFANICIKELKVDAQLSISGQAGTSQSTTDINLRNLLSDWRAAFLVSCCLAKKIKDMEREGLLKAPYCIGCYEEGTSILGYMLSIILRTKLFTTTNRDKYRRNGKPMKLCGDLSTDRTHTVVVVNDSLAGGSDFDACCDILKSEGFTRIIGVLLFCRESFKTRASHDVHPCVWLDDDNFISVPGPPYKEMTEKYKLYPRILLTDRCNLHCGYCHNEGQGREVQVDSSKTYSFEPEAISLWKTLAAALKEQYRYSKGQKLVFSGGEPLLYTNIDTVIRCFKDVGFQPYLTTNGSHLTIEKLESIKAAGIAGINVSLYSNIRDDYDQFHGVQREGRAFQTLSEALGLNGQNVKSYLAQSGLEVKVNLIFDAKDLEDDGAKLKQKVKFFSELSSRTGYIISYICDLKNTHRDLPSSDVQKILLANNFQCQESLSDGRTTLVYTGNSGDSAARWEFDHVSTGNRDVNFCNGCKNHCDGFYALRIARGPKAFNVTPCLNPSKRKEFIPAAARKKVRLRR